jgi:hypothetical protein
LNDLALPEMSAAEAQRTNAAIKAGITTVRALLQDMRDRKGWKALGYSSFDEYGKTELGYGKAYIHHLANAADVAGSLGLSTKVDETPETHLRPLAPLSDEERRKVWQEATAQAEAEQKKLTAKMVQEAVEKLKAEREESQQRFDLAVKQGQEWRQQALAEKKAKADAEQLTKTAQSEAATLRRTLAAEAEKLASAKLAELKHQIDSLNIDKAELTDKLKTLHKQQDEAVETRTKQHLQAQQDEINRKEAQLRAIEGRINTLNERLTKTSEQDQIVSHFTQATQDIRATLNTLGHQIQVAIDPEEAPYLPEPFLSTFERLAESLEQGAAGVRSFLGAIDIRSVEVSTNE